MLLRLILSLLPLLAAQTTVHAAEPAAKARLEQGLAELAAATHLNVGFAIKDLVTGDEFIRNGDTVYAQGSTIRIHLVTELYRQHAEGKLSIDDSRPLPESARIGGHGVLRFMDARIALTLRDYAVLAITVNDNTAANFLTDVVGMNNVNASMVAQGTPEIRFLRKATYRHDAPQGLPRNEGTPRAVMRALELIHRGAVVDRRTSDEILEVLALPEISYFRRDLPPGVRFAGRSGSGLTYRCDAGIVLLEGNPYILCVMVDGLNPRSPNRRDEASQADQLVVRASRLALDYFLRSERRGAHRGKRD